MDVESKKNDLTPKLPPVEVTAKSAEAKVTDKKSEAPKKLDLEFVPSVPTSVSGAAVFAKKTSGPMFSGPGVATSVFGATSPNIKGWSDAELAKNMSALASAMKTNLGKINDYDFTLMRAMIFEAAGRQEQKLAPTLPPAQMSVPQLFETLVAFDAKKESGHKLTPAQAEVQTKAEAEWTKRSKVDNATMLSELGAKRAKLHDQAFRQCASVVSGAAAMTGNHFAAGIASGVLITNALLDKDYGGAVREGAMVLVSLTSEKYAPVLSAVSLAESIYTCHETSKELARAETAYKFYEDKAKAQAVSK